MQLAIALGLASILSGTLVTYLYDDESTLGPRVCAGSAIGFAALGIVGFTIGSAMGLTDMAVALTGATVALPLLLLLNPRRRNTIAANIVSSGRQLAGEAAVPIRLVRRWAVPMMILVFLWLVFDRAFFQTPEGMYTGVANNYGDLPFHLAAITRFAHGNVPPEDPTYAGIAFTYPFLVDLAAAFFVRGGMTLRQAMLVENMALAVAFVVLLHRWAFELTGSRSAATVSVFLLLLSGGFGWLLLFRDARISETGIISLLGHLPHDYTILPEGAWRWGNSVTSLLIPQRGFLLGLPLAIIVFTELWIVMKRSAESEAAPGDNSASNRRRMVAAGLIAGLLPLAHAYSFGVVIVVAGCLAMLDRRWRLWGLFFAGLAVLSAPQVLWAASTSSSHFTEFLSWNLGWDRDGENIAWFWLKNTGLFIPSLLAALIWLGKKRVIERRLLIYYLPFTLCFLAPNLLKLAPWIWDNIKVIIYWYAASTAMVAMLIVYVWRSGKPGRRIAAALFVSLVLAGSLDVWRIISRASELQVFDRGGLAFANLIVHETRGNVLILHAPTFNHPVFLTGRRSLMGYPGHLWTHGIDYSQREADIRSMYAGSDEALALMSRYGVDYAVLGPLERSLMPVDDLFFARFTEVGRSGEYRLFKVRNRE